VHFFEDFFEGIFNPFRIQRRFKDIDEKSKKRVRYWKYQLESV